MIFYVLMLFESATIKNDYFYVIWGLPKIRGTILGSILGSPDFGKLPYGCWQELQGDYEVMDAAISQHGEVGCMPLDRSGCALLISYLWFAIVRESIIMGYIRTTITFGSLCNLDQCWGSFILFGVWDSSYLFNKDPFFFLG